MARIVIRPALVVDTSGEASPVDLPTGPTLTFLQTMVGGTVDVIRFGAIPGTDLELDLWVNDEGAINGSGINPVLSALASFLHDMPFPVYGSGVFAASDGNGDTVPLPFPVVETLVRTIRGITVPVPMHTDN